MINFSGRMFLQFYEVVLKPSKTENRTRRTKERKKNKKIVK